MASMAVFLRSHRGSLLRLSTPCSSSSPSHLFSAAYSYCSPSSYSDSDDEITPIEFKSRPYFDDDIKSFIKSQSPSSRGQFNFSHGPIQSLNKPSASSIEASRNSPLRRASPPLPSGENGNVNPMSMDETESQLKSNSEGKSKYFRWTSEMDRVLLDALLRQVNAGNRGNVRFSTPAIDEVVEEVRTKTNTDSLERTKVHSRLQTLKRSFVEVYDAFKGLSGFWWNPTSTLIEADEERWDDLIKSNPKAAQWREKPIPHYDKLKELWGKDGDTDEQTLSTKGRAQGSSSQTNDEQETAIEAHIDERTLSTKGRAQRSSSQTNDEQETATEAHTGGLGGFGTSPLKPERDDTVVTMVSEIGKSLGRIADALAKSVHRVYSSEEIYAELERLEIDDDTKFHAVEALTKEECLAQVLFGIPVQERRSWLLRRLYARK